MKRIRNLLIIGMLVLSLFLSKGVVMAQVTSTPTPTETVLVTTPSVTVFPTVIASGSATPTKVTSLPKTGIMQYTMAFLMIGVGVILFAFVF